MTATLIKAKVKFPAKGPIQTQYGERINVIVTLPDGTEQKLWGSPGSVLASYAKGEEIVLALENGKYKVVEIPPEVDGNPTQNKAPNGLGIPTPEAISQACQLMATCYQEMARLLDGVPPEQLQAMACTVFIQLMRR
ncbi:MAG: hypothetical protein NZL92_08010 [Gloeomargarita sp. SKYG116]|nr:hypothetical protein [Gloeomargarita sp. SKYG116]MDW8401625.1 hypothetical protein [Gloeomargarita sp. SKYGB_i_bin116]